MRIPSKLFHLPAIIRHPTIARASWKFLRATTASSLWWGKTNPMIKHKRIIEIEHFFAWPWLALPFPCSSRSLDCLTSISMEVPRFRMLKFQLRKSCFARLIYLWETSFPLRSRSCICLSLIENPLCLKRIVLVWTSIAVSSDATDLKKSSI